MIKKRKSSFSSHLAQSRRRMEVASLRRRLCEEEGQNRKGEAKKIKEEEEEVMEESEAQRILRKLRKSQAAYVRERMRRGECWVPTQKIPR